MVAGNSYTDTTTCTAPPASAQSEQRGGERGERDNGRRAGLSEERGVRGDGGRPGGEAGAGWGRRRGRAHMGAAPARRAGRLFCVGGGGEGKKRTSHAK